MFKKKSKILNIVIFLIIFLFIAFGFFFLKEYEDLASKNISKNVSVEKQLEIKTGNSKKVTFEINDIKFEHDFKRGSTVYDLMEQLKKEEKITFTDKNYVGMGKFIDSINGKKGNSDYAWIFYINGEKAQVGVSNYKVNAGDVISFKYEKTIY